MALASAQHLVCSLAQLLDLGFSAEGVRSRTRRSRLFRVHHSVYSLVPPDHLTVKGRWMAAVLACGSGAVLSHRSAAALHQIRRTERAKIEVTVPRRSVRAHEGLQVHRSITLAEADVTLVDGIPCTTVARTLVDLAAVLPRRPVERAFDQAEMEEILDVRAVLDQLRRNPNRRGTGKIRSILAEHYIGKTATVNDLEEAMYALCRRVAIPLPEVNQWVDLGDGEPPIKADFLWREQRVIVETDGVRSHGTRQARQRDPRRDQRAIVAGWCPVRTTGNQVYFRPRELEQVLLRLVGAGTRVRLRAA